MKEDTPDNEGEGEGEEEKDDKKGKKKNGIVKIDNHRENGQKEVIICETDKSGGTSNNDGLMRRVQELFEELKDSVKHIDPIRKQLKTMNNKHGAIESH